MKTRLFILLALLTSVCYGGQYYFTDDLTNGNDYSGYSGVVGTGYSWSPEGFHSPFSDGASLIGNSPPTGNSDYQVYTKLRIVSSGGTYIQYLRGTTDSRSGPSPSGTFYSVELENVVLSGGGCTADLSVYRRYGGSTTLLGSAEVTCHNDLEIRSFIRTDGNYVKIRVHLDDVKELEVSGWGTIPSGLPGIGARSSPYDSGIVEVSFGGNDTTAPSSVSSLIGVSPFPDYVDMQWPPADDGANGTGVWYYEIKRNGTTLATITDPLYYSDLNVSPSTSYSYQIKAVDFFENESTTSFTVSTPPSGAIDPRRVGISPTGAYWGAGNEQIDMRSGNMNYTVPLLSAVGRGGWSVPFALNYNSQAWRKDNGGTWRLGRDVGYGWGFRLLAGSITPYWSDFWTLDHYVYTDSTGAEYRLDIDESGVWRTDDGIYLWYDSSDNTLHFPDGTWWEMNCVSGPTEQDAGTRYPTKMWDTNGNWIKVRYDNMKYGSQSNTSARITSIEDARARNGTNYTRTYEFQYTDSYGIPRLMHIINNIGTGESYDFYHANVSFSSPFSPYESFGYSWILFKVQQQNSPLSTQFVYNGSGEMTELVLPNGGRFGWDYRDFTYEGGVKVREVYQRKLKKSASASWETYPIYHDDSNDANRSIHSYSDLRDPSGNGARYWEFKTSSGFDFGFPTKYEARETPSLDAVMRRDYTWARYSSTSNPYIGTVLTTIDPGESYQKQSKVEQTLDANGNLTQQKQYGYGSLSTPARTFNYTYLTGSNYSSRYIFNRVDTVEVTDGTNTVQLVDNTYDDYTGYSTLYDPGTFHEHDETNYGTSFGYRGNITSNTVNEVTNIYKYDIGGNLYKTKESSTGNEIEIESAKQYTVPGTITPNGNSNLAVSYDWNAFLGLTQQTNPNGDDSSITYDTLGRKITASSPQGASVTWSYDDTNHVITATADDDRSTKTYVDGLGRPIKVERRDDGDNLKSTTETEYDSCACSAVGKVKRVSMPYAPSGTVYWTTYTYDALGRTVSVALPDSAGTTTYVYEGNTVKVTDPAGDWKKFYRDAFGNILQVDEPNPGGGTVSTYYTYNMRDQLTQVSMTRDSVTQTRTFSYDLDNGRLDSVTLPESGTTSYTYNSDGTLATKTDAKSQVTSYTYDSYGRVTEIDAEGDVVTYTYDTDPFGSGSYPKGRLSTVKYGDTSTGAGEFTEMYGYNEAGLTTKKRLQLKRDYSGSTPSGYLDVDYTYDNQGRMTSYAFDGDTFNYGFDSMGRPDELTMTGDANPFVKDVLYGPAGEMTQIKYRNTTSGTFHTETRSYNNLKQLTRITVGSVMDIQYTYSATANDGKITSQKDWISGEEVSYQYDSLKRLVSSATTGPEWGLSFTYDGFGNRTAQTVTKGTAPSSSLTISKTNNRLTGSSFSYDNNGNLTKMPGPGCTLNLSYDPYNRLEEVTTSSCGSEQYAYAPNNRRVWKATTTTGTDEVIYFYGADGNRLMELEPVVTTGSITFTKNRRYIYFGRRQIRVNGSSGEPIMLDRLGSVRREGTEDLTYFPYGEEGSTTDQNRDKFATYYRDELTALDYAHNRYYSSIQGRFTRPDPVGQSGRGINSQQLNLYAYTGGDPVNRYDPSGLEWVAAMAGRFSDELCAIYQDYEPNDCVWVDPFAPTDPVSLEMYHTYTHTVINAVVQGLVASGDEQSGQTFARSQGAEVSAITTTFNGESTTSYQVTFHDVDVTRGNPSASPISSGANGSSGSPAGLPPPVMQQPDNGRTIRTLQVDAKIRALLNATVTMYKLPDGKYCGGLGLTLGGQGASLGGLEVPPGYSIGSAKEMLEGWGWYAGIVPGVQMTQSRTARGVPSSLVGLGIGTEGMYVGYGYVWCEN